MGAEGLSSEKVGWSKLKSLRSVASSSLVKSGKDSVKEGNLSGKSAQKEE